MIVMEGPDPEVFEPRVEEGTTGYTEEPTLQTLQLSSALAYDFDGPQTMKFVGGINGEEVIVMVDSGATHGPTWPIHYDFRLIARWPFSSHWVTTRISVRTTEGICPRIEL